MVKPRLLGFKIVEPQFLKKVEDMTASEVLNLEDKRDFLDINYKPLQKNVVLGKIMPEGKEKAVDEEDFKVGPGRYDPSVKLTKPTTTKLGAKMAKINEFNDRMNMMDLADDENYEFLYEPDYTLAKPSTTLLGKINSKTKEVKPPNVPEAELNPEKWQFYDKNTKLTKPNTEIGGRFVNKLLEDPNKFVLHENEKELLKEYMQIGNRNPDPGYYDPMFGLIESGIIGVPHFERYLERSVLPTREELMNMEIDGDNLVFSRELKKSKIKNTVVMDKMIGRNDLEKDKSLIGFDDLDVSLLLAEEKRKL